MRNVMVRPDKVTATLMYPNTDRKLFLTFDGKGTEYCVVVNNNEARKLQARLKSLFGENEDVKTLKLEL